MRSSSSVARGRTIQQVDTISKNCTVPAKKPSSAHTFRCPSCGHLVEALFKGFDSFCRRGIDDFPSLPAGMKFDPTDLEILHHLEGKVFADESKLHPLIDGFISTIEGENGICYTHPENLPGVSNDGQVRHFFHRPSKAYTTGTRKRRKVSTDEDASETRWHKTGKTRPITAGDTVKGFKKILVLYTNYGRQRKPEKTNWVMHQYHLGNNEEEKDGELVVSKVFYQTQPRQCGSFIKENDVSSVKTKNTAFFDYCNASYIAYDDGCRVSRESFQQILPNLVVQDDGSSFIRFAPNASKGNLNRK